MDVTFTNVLEGARQYFQGLPSAQAQAADSPFYRHHQQQQQHAQPLVQQPTSTLQPTQQHQVTSQQHLNHHPTNQHFTQNQTNQHHSNPATNQQYNLPSQQYGQASQQYSPTNQQYSQTGQHYSQTSQRYGQSSQQFVSQQLSNQQASSQQHSTQQLSSQLHSGQQLSSQQISSQKISSQQHPSQQHSSQQHTSQQVSSQQLSSQFASSPQLSSQQLSSQQLSNQQLSSQQLSSQQLSIQQPLQSRQHGSPAYSNSNSAGPPTPQSPWADQNRPPTRERTPNQRPSSHSSDGSRPPSHQSQQSFQTQEQTARQFQQQNLYQKEPATSQAMVQNMQQQGFNFSQPQSRDPYRSQVPTSSSYNQTASTQLSRSSSKEQLVQPGQNYQYSSAYPKSQYGYAQGSYYQQQQAKTNSTTGQVKMSVSDAYPTSTQNSYKAQTAEPYPNSNQRLNPYLQVTNNDRFNQQRYLTDNANNRTQVTISHPQSTQPVETSYRNSHTHNLPPIAALSSYHSSRTSQQKEPNKEQPSASSYSRESYFHSNSYSSSSIIKPNQTQSFTSVASTLPHITSHQQRSNVSQSVSSYPHSSTMTTSSYSSVIMSNVSSTNVQPTPQSYYHGPNKAFLKNSEDYRFANNQVNANLSQNMASQPSTVVESKNVPVIKENPLDLSVKTVKTTADSTLQESETYSKIQPSQRTNSQSHIYPTFDLQKNLAQRTQPPSVLSAPKVDFQPKFNIPPSNRQPFPTDKANPHLPKPTLSNPYNTSYRKPEVNVSKLPYNNQSPSSHVNPYQYSHYRPSNLPPSNYMPDPRQQNVPRSYQTPDTKKRAAEVTSSVIPEKMPKIEPWRQSIDLQIEQKLSTYKQDKLHHSPSEGPNATLNFPSANARDVYNYNQREQYKNSIPQPPKNIPNVSVPYTHHQTNHTQSYVPTPNAHQYSNYNQLPKHVNNHFINPYAAALNPMLPPNINKNQISGSVDRKTLNLLRNSIETKEQKKIEQQKTQENLPLHPRPDIQHSNTDVTAPLQPKLGVVGRNNVSPFTPTSFPETNMASMYKFNPLKPPMVNNHQTQLKDLVKLEENNTVIVNNTHSGSDYDGLAAFLAARIRTKGEMKQVGPISSQLRVQKYINDQINSPPPPLSESPVVQNAIPNSTQSSAESISPPKLSKEMSSRKRLFSKTEEEQTLLNNLPLRDKTGIRSSSETSVFDFDDDDDNQMPVLERQSLEAMRRDRRSSLKTTSVGLDEVKQEENNTVVNLPPPSRTPSPFDDIFDSICDNFVDFLKHGPKKKGGRKKKIDSESPIEVKTEMPDPTPEHLDFTMVQIKKEFIEEESNKTENNNSIESTITPHKIGILSDSDLSDSETRTEDRLAVRNKNRVRRKILSSSESSDEDSKDKNIQKSEEKENIDKDTITIKEEVKDKELKKEEAVESKNSELIKPVDIKKEKMDMDPPTIETKPPEAEIKVEPVQKTDALTVIRPAKKPLFGTGSEFCQPGWEEDVFKYKKSLRMPSSLIQVTRPPNSRLSTSLPDLDPPCPPSPTPSMVTDSEASKDCNNKKLIKKFKSEPIDSDSESTTSFNIFKKKTNYDSEESTSSLPNTKKEKSSILDKLLEKCGGRKKRQYNRKDDHSPKVVPKSDNNLLPTPGFEASEKESPVKDKKIKGPIVSEKSALLNFRKDTINNFKDAFIKSNNTVISNKFATVVLTSRTRKETKALQQRATIKEVFGAERPASAPPCEVTAMNNVKIKEEVLENTEFSVKLKELAMQKEAEVIKQIKAETKDKETKDKIKENFEKGDRDIKEKDDTLDKEIKQEILDDSDGETKLIEFVIKRDPDAKFETTSLDSEEGLVNKRRNKFGKLRRKFSSGFDYIRKKKKIKKDVASETGETPPCVEKKKRLSNKTLESVDDIQKEIKTWVLNKGIGETHLHRAARLGYTDITAYCLEKTDCHPSPKDNAGYTPLHEACSRGHLQIAKLLLMYGANVHESAQGGIRPLHMAVENGFVEIVRLLLSYGADPALGTYAGMTPINLANDEDTKDLLLHHVADRGGDRGPPWHFRGPATCFDDPEDLGYDIFDSPPKMESEHELDDIDFEVSESMLPNLYTIRNESQADKWVLLQDLSNYLKVKSRDTLLRQLSTNNDQASARTLIRELKMADFLEQARCCQFLNQGEKLNTRANKIALVKYNDKVKELLGIEMVTVTR